MKNKIINKGTNSKNGFYAMLLNSIFLASLIFLPINDALAEKNLSTLQQQIKAGKNNQKLQTKQQKKLDEQVATSEQEIAAATLKLQQTEQAINEEASRLGKLRSDTTQLKKDKMSQQILLEQQLISAYMTGQNDLVKLLLNQEDLSKIIRAKSYYHYLNKARLESIEKLQATQLLIEKNSGEQANALLSLQNMRKEQVISNKKLIEERDKRSIALSKLKKEINYQTVRLAQLRDAEKKLKKTLKKQSEARGAQDLAAAKAKATRKMKPKTEEKSHSRIAKLKGKLKWPINGKVLASFGSQRSDQVRWKGISIAANEGEKVRAVATGRVLFAGYFKGYGMVIALDHSDDYITLYGYNQTLLQKTGDTVFEGDAIALAGHSGGQDKNSLYFELSHQGTAKNPTAWLKRR